jgi:hypothetical protein
VGVASAEPRGDFVLVECRRPSARSFFDTCFCGGFFTCILHDSASLKTSPPREEKSAGQNKIVFANYKGESALMSQAFVLTMKGPSHLGSSLPLDSVRAVRTSTRSPSLNSLGMTTWSRHAFVWAWYLFRACRAKTRSPSMRSFEVGSSTSGTADETVRGDPCFISCGVMASDPYRRQKGVNPVALHSIVFSAQTASGNKSAHLPFFRRGASF